MSPRVLVVLGLLSTLSPAELAAQPASASTTSCDRETSALSRSVCTLAGALAGKVEGPLVVAASATGDERSVAVPARVTERLAQLLAEKLPGARSESRALPLAEAQRSAGAARGLVYLTVALYRDRLDVSADVYGGAGRFWQRVRSPGLTLKQHALASGPLDAELRALFPAIPLVVTRIDKASTSERDIVALGCGDVRGDGSSEIAAVGRRKVLVGRLERGRFAPRATLSWADSSAIAGSPLREPIATCTLPEPGKLWIGLSDRGDALELSGSLQVQQRFHGWMPWPGGGCTRRSGLGYEGRAQSCPGATGTANVDFGTPVDAFVTRSLTDREGRARVLRAARAVGSETLRVLDSLHPEVVVPNAGAQIALGDLDLDGMPEVVSSLPTLDRRTDQLVVRTITDNGQLRERFRVSVASGIDAVAICPGDGRAMAPLALATGDGIWVIR